MRQIKPTCNASGPDGLKCFQLEGHAGRHRSSKVYEWHGESPTLETELTAAREEIAALKADKERLDWLLSQGTYCPYNLTFQIDIYRTPRQTAIEAIDAARTSEGK